MNINYYNPYVRAELELYHHGVAGQKWGKRNGPPYPLGASQASAAEKKAGWKKSEFAGGSGRRGLSDTDQILKKNNRLFFKKELSEEDRARLHEAYISRMSESDMEELKKSADKLLKAWNMQDYFLNNRNKFTTDEEKDIYERKMDEALNEAFETANKIGDKISKNDKYKNENFYGRERNISRKAIHDKQYEIARQKKDKITESKLKSGKITESKLKSGKLSDSQMKEFNLAKNKDIYQVDFLKVYYDREWSPAKRLSEYKKYLIDPNYYMRHI